MEKNIQAIERAFLALETISRIGPISFTDLLKELNFNKASLSRIIATLISTGYIEKNQEHGTLSITLKAYEIGISAVQNQRQISLINSVLVDLRNETNLISQFSIEENNDLLCLQSLGHENTVFSVHSDVGSRTPLYASSAGKAILATYSNSEIMKKWETFDIKPLTTHTHTNFESLMSDIDQVRKRGYALDMEENDYGLFCLGTVIMGHTRTPVGAISISSNSMTEAEEQRLSQIVIQHAKRLSTLLGFAQ